MIETLKDRTTEHTEHTEYNAKASMFLFLPFLLFSVFSVCSVFQASAFSMSFATAHGCADGVDEIADAGAAAGSLAQITALRGVFSSGAW
jgi:hypothetical protein